MALEPYSPCPCGSGKKFKWCCQPIHVGINKAFEQDHLGQHEAALRTMAEVVAANPTNPEVYGRQAQLLYQNDRADEAESALQKALELNPKYPFGHLLRGMFRQHEGELPGALLLFRKAAELYDPEAKDILAHVYSLIADCEMRMNRPVAARAAIKISLHCRPDEQLQASFDNLFGEQSHLPLSARREYTFQRPSEKSSPDRLEAWQRALVGASSGKLSDVLHAFEQLTREYAEDPSAWYNLALARAWLGDNARALEALDRYVELQPDEGRAAAAWALGEVLRFGHGMEDQADYVEHSSVFRVTNPQQLLQFFQTWEQERRLAGVQVRQEEGAVTGLVLERVVALTPESAAAQAPGLGAYFLLLGELLRVWGSDADAVEQICQELQQRVGDSLSEPHRRRSPAHFPEVWAAALAFPVGASDKEEAARRVREHVQRYFEEKWIHQPLRSVSGVPPIDAAGSPQLRKKLLGVLQFIKECGPADTESYDLDRLRRKLGLTPAGAAPAAVESTASPDIEAMGAGELAALQPEQLAEEQVERAYQAAVRLDAHELASRFARNLVGRPPRADRPDRWPLYTYLLQRALTEGKLDEALDLVNEGEKADCEHNEGRRRNDYELKRGQVLLKRGEGDQARDVFERLLERVPSELRYRATAAEALLSARQGAAALRIAEQGLQEARKRNDRDSEDHFKELIAAARRQVG